MAIKELCSDQLIRRVHYLSNEICRIADAMKTSTQTTFSLGSIKGKLEYVRSEDSHFDKAWQIHTELQCLVPEEKKKTLCYFKDKLFAQLQKAYGDLINVLEDRLDSLYKTSERAFITSTSVTSPQNQSATNNASASSA